MIRVAARTYPRTLPEDVEFQTSVLPTSDRCVLLPFGTIPTLLGSDGRRLHSLYQYISFPHAGLGTMVRVRISTP
jgi:hypothetical protein